MKIGLQNEPKNYKPICLYSCIFKLLDILYMVFKDFFENTKLIIPFQIGFMQHFQTKDNLIHIMLKCMKSFEHKINICIVFFNI